MDAAGELLQLCACSFELLLQLRDGGGEEPVRILGGFHEQRLDLREAALRAVRSCRSSLRRSASPASTKRLLEPSSSSTWLRISAWR